LNEQVLVVDDDERVLDSILRALELEDISAIGISDPTKAVESFRNNPADVVVVDFVFDKTPQLTGLNIISAIQKIKPVTRTILISGRIDHDKLDEEGLEKELQAKVSCDYYLPKSGVRDQLVETVKAALDNVQNRATDWKSLAEDYEQVSKVTPESVRNVNEAIKETLLEQTDQAGEE
jgi:DNA-binding NtrC family response regulator